MIRYLGIFLILALTGCGHPLINRSAVKMIRVVRYRDEDDSITINYTDHNKIDHIIKALNNNKKEPIMFEMNCTLHIIYADSTVNILCNGTAVKYKGKTYRTSNSIEETLN